MRSRYVATIYALLLVSGCLFASTVWAASGEESIALGRPSALPESLVNGRQPLESIQAAQGAWGLNAAADLGAGDLSLELRPGLVMSRVTHAALAPVAGVAWGSALQQDTTDTLSLAFGKGSQISVSHLVTNSQDLASRLISGAETSRLGFSQAFGSGQSAGTLTMERSWASQLSGNSLTKTNSQVLGLTAGLGSGYNLGTKFTETWDGAQFGQSSRAFEAALGVPFSGGQGSLGFSRSAALNGTTQTGATIYKLAAPLNLFRGKANLTGTRTLSYVDSAEVADTLASFTTPLPGKVKFAGNWHTIDASTPGANTLFDRGMIVDFPSFFGQAGHFDTQRLSQSQTGALHTLAVDNFTLPLGFIDRKGIAEYHLRDEFNSGVLTRAISGQISTPLPLAHKQATALYSIKDNIDANGRNWGRLFAVFVPVKMFDDTTRFDWKASTTSAPGSWQRDRLLSLNMPLTSLLRGAAFSQSYERLSTGGPAGTILTSALTAPWKSFGTTGDFKQQYITTETEGGYQARLVTDLGAQVNHERLSLSREFTRTRTGDTYQDRQMLALTTPRFELFTPKATISAGRVQITENPGVDSNKTTMDLAAQPTEKLSIAARLQQETADPGADVRSEQLVTSLAMGKYVSLQGRIESRDQNDQPSAGLVRSFQIKREQDSPSGVGLLVGYASWEAPGTASAEGPDVQLKTGDSAKGVGVLAQLSGYDATKMTPYNDPLVKISLSHGVTGGMSVKVDYNDQEGRLAPESNYALGMQALGGDLQVGFAQNPLDRTGKVVLLADRYDAALQRKVGTIDVKLDYRLYNFRQPMGTESAVDYYRVQLAGGVEEKGGKLALGYTMGDFVPQPDPNIAVPATVLDLSYTRRWADSGRFIVSLQRNTAPDNTPSVPETMQGRLEYSTIF